MNHPLFELVKCRVCGREYRRALKRISNTKRTGKINCDIRGKNTICCSKKCSNEHNYFVHYGRKKEGGQK